MARPSYRNVDRYSLSPGERVRVRDKLVPSPLRLRSSIYCVGVPRLRGSHGLVLPVLDFEDRRGFYCLLNYLYLIGCFLDTRQKKSATSSASSVAAVVCNVRDDVYCAPRIGAVSSSSYINTGLLVPMSTSCPRTRNRGVPAPMPTITRAAMLPAENSVIEFSNLNARLSGLRSASLPTNVGTICLNSMTLAKSRLSVWRTISRRSRSLSSFGVTVVPTGCIRMALYPLKSKPSAIQTFSNLSVLLNVMPSADFSFGAEAQPGSMITAVRISR